MLGCFADGKHLGCRFCGEGNYSDIECPSSTCSFPNEPVTPYYWEPLCRMGMLGCNADGIHAQCRFCDYKPFQKLACPGSARPPYPDGKCWFPQGTSQSYKWDPSCRWGKLGCWADGVNAFCRYCGSGSGGVYEKIKCKKEEKRSEASLFPWTRAFSLPTPYSLQFVDTVIDQCIFWVSGKWDRRLSFKDGHLIGIWQRFLKKDQKWEKIRLADFPFEIFADLQMFLLEKQSQLVSVRSHVCKRIPSIARLTRRKNACRKCDRLIFAKGFLKTRWQQDQRALNGKVLQTKSSRPSKTLLSNK